MNPYLPLLRLDKPIGIWLVFFPAAWAVLLASPSMNVPLLLVMLVGAVVMRGAGCIMNDLADRKLDAQVERTRSRPLASGTVPVQQAYILLAVLLLVGLLLALSLPIKVLLLSLLALPFIAAYPFMKRITWWPQLFLGLTFNFGALIGWVATGQPFTATSWLLYAACVFWTLGYDTIYALQDMEDDRAAGIKSTARRLGERVRPFVAICYGIMIFLLMLAGWQQGAGGFYLLGLIGITLHARWQLKHMDLSQPQHMGALFRSNQWLGAGFFIALLLDRI